MEQFYTPEEVAGLLKLNRETIYRWIRAGKIKAVKLGPVWRISESELQRFLRGEESPPKSSS